MKWTAERPERDMLKLLFWVGGVALKHPLWGVIPITHFSSRTPQSRAGFNPEPSHKTGSWSMQHGAAAALRLLGVGVTPHTLRGTVPSASLCRHLPSFGPWLQEARHSLGTKGARRQHGGQIHTGCESLCAATSHSHCDSSAQSSARLMLLAGRRREQCEGCAVHPPVLQDGSVPSRAAFPPGTGGAAALALGREESAHLQTGVGLQDCFSLIGAHQRAHMPHRTLAALRSC